MVKALWDTPTRSADAVGRVEAQTVGGPAIKLAGPLVAGRYRLGSLLGRGGMGRVWLAEDEVLHRPVALKQVDMKVPLSDATRRAAFAGALREARAAARVDHGGVVRIHDVVRQDGCPWIVMEKLSGRTLGALDVDGPLPVHEVKRVGLALIDVVQAVHQAGVVHRDVKPANVLLCEGGRVVLTDFGIAWTTKDDASVSTGLFAGSPAYIAPEQVRGGEPEPASDLFSLGATLFAAVEGRPAFDRGDVYDTLAAVIHDAPAPFQCAGPLRPARSKASSPRTPGGGVSAAAARLALEAVGVSRYSEVRVAEGEARRSP